jgi:small subunit ribosomal protein S6
MRVYELMIIFDGDLEAEALEARLSKVTANIESEGGRIASLKDSAPWGRRRFAYRINHKWEGVYVVLDVVTEAGNLDSTDRILRLADRSEVVRHKIIRLPDAEVARRGLLGEAEPADAGLGTE